MPYKTLTYYLKMLSDKRKNEESVGTEDENLRKDKNNET